MIGESGGRTGRNQPRTGARRRFTPDERAARTPITDNPEEWQDDNPHSYGRARSLRDRLHDAMGITELIGGIFLVSTHGPWLMPLGGTLLGAFYAHMRSDR